MNDDNILDQLPKDLITVAYKQAKGNEIDSGKFQHPESSVALAGNAFGFFLNQPGELPPIPGTETAADWGMEGVARRTVLPGLGLDRFLIGRYAWAIP